MAQWLRFCLSVKEMQQVQVWSLDKEDPYLTVGNGNPLQYFWVQNLMDRAAWWVQSLGSHRIRHNLATKHKHKLSIYLIFVTMSVSVWYARKCLYKRYTRLCQELKLKVEYELTSQWKRLMYSSRGSIPANSLRGRNIDGDEKWED